MSDLLYRDTVRIKDGFYAGQTGRVMRHSTYGTYGVWLDNDPPTYQLDFVWFEASSLEITKRYELSAN